MNQWHRYHQGSARASSGPPRCARPLPFHMITVNTISAERQTLSRNAHALALGRRLRQGSVGARRRSAMESSSASRTTRHVFVFSLHCLQTFSYSLMSTAGIPISPFRLYRDPLWCLSRYLRDARHHPKAHRGNSSAEPRATSKCSRIRLSNSSAQSCTSRRSPHHCKPLLTSSRRLGALVLKVGTRRLASRSSGSGARLWKRGEGA